MKRSLCVFIVVLLALQTQGFPLEPHDDMPPEAFDFVAGTEASHPQVDEMDVVECDDQVGKIPSVVHVWPSPGPLPSRSPQPEPIPLFSANFTLSNTTTNFTKPVVQPPPPSCEDDTEFVDSLGLSCRDYTMNKELCRIAERYVNSKGQSARHACCRCGGGKHVVGVTLKKCIHPSMGDCEEADVTLRTQHPLGPEGKMSSRLESDLLPGTVIEDYNATLRMGGGNSYDKVVKEDEIEDDAVDYLGTIKSVDTILEPDSIVFRDRNFIGYPREPDAIPPKKTGFFAVIGTIKFYIPFEDTFESTYGPILIQSISKASYVDASAVTLTAVKPGSVVVSFRVASEKASLLQAQSQAQTLLKAFTDGTFMDSLTYSSFPRCNMTVILAPMTEEILLLADTGLGASDPHKFFSTESYIVKPRETIYTIAQKFRISTSLLVSFNQDVADPMVLKAGDVLFIPKPKIIQVSRISPMESPLEGGVDVLVHGVGFVYPAYCRFGSVIVEASYVVDGTLVCTSPEQKEPGLVSFSVSDGKGGFFETSFMYHYTVGMIPFCDEPGARPSWCRPRLAIYSVAPVRVPQDTEAVIVISGSGFNSSTVCYLDNAPAKTTVISRTNLTCVLTERAPSINTVSLHQESLVASTQYQIVVYSTLSVSAIEPIHGPDAGGYEVTLTGTTFKQGGYCRFGEVIVPTIYKSSETVVCLAPAHKAEVVRIEVSNDGVAFSPSNVSFEFTSVQVFNLSQDAGPSSGGNIITVSGYGFYVGAWCRFGSQKTLAEFHNLTTIRCMVPPQAEMKTVIVSVSLDGNSGFSQELVYYNYFGAITEVRPSTGRSTGGDDIHVFGQGFDPSVSYSCIFGHTAVPATVITNSQIQCTSPPGIGTVPFVVESAQERLRKNILGEFIKFTYNSSPGSQVSAAFPSHINVRTENVSVVLSGHGFVPGMLCKFGDKISQSKYISSTTISCIAPKRDLAEIVPISVSFNGGQTWSQTLSMFEYLAVTQYISPPLGHVNGGNVVQVKGYGFNYRVSLCVFGNRVVPATVVDEFQLSCIAPPSDAPARVRFAVTTNDTTLYDPYLEFAFPSLSECDDWGTWYVYSDNPHFFVSEVSPKTATTMGGDVVYVNGEGFDNSGHCVFGAEVVKAEFLDAATVRCITPPHLPGVVDLSVTVYDKDQGYNQTIVGTKFEFVPPKLFSIDPTDSFITGGSVASIHGEYLTGARSCRFGSLRSQVIFGNSTDVTCLIPETNSAALLPVVVEFNGTGVSNGEVFFQYHPRILSVTPRSELIYANNRKIRFSGIGFNGDHILCVFNEESFVPATIISNSEIECQIPVETAPKIVSLRLANAHNHTLGLDTFDFKYNFVVRSSHPAYGPSTGGTTVVVVGSALSSVTHCKFDGILTPAFVISDIMARCKTPEHSTGLVHFTLVSLGNDGLPLFESNPSDFTYKLLATRVESIHPTSGSITGGALITVRGTGFSIASFCRFGTKEVPVTYFSPNHITCFSPPVNQPQTVPLEVSQLDPNEGFSIDNHLFAYGTEVSTVDHIEPEWDSEGATITVVGSGFVQESACFFGSRRAQTEFVSSSELKCIVPEMLTRADEVIQVSEGSHLPGGHVIFHYLLSNSQDSVVVREAIPNHGPTTGNTVVDVYGVNFPEEGICRFGDLLMTFTYISHTHVQCISPRHHASSVVLEVVSADRRSFSNSAIRFTFKDTQVDPIDDLFSLVPGADPTLEHINPTVGRAGDEITLFGDQFATVGYCVFSQGTISIQSEAKIVDSTQITCQVPEPVPGMKDSVSVSYMSVTGTISGSVGFTYA